MKKFSLLAGIMLRLNENISFSYMGSTFTCTARPSDGQEKLYCWKRALMQNILDTTQGKEAVQRLSHFLLSSCLHFNPAKK